MTRQRILKSSKTRKTVTQHIEIQTNGAGTEKDTPLPKTDRAIISVNYPNGYEG